MPIPLFFDTCVWDYLYDKKLDVGTELPRTEFSIIITSETRIEIERISNEHRRSSLLEAVAQIAPEDAIFGFAEANAEQKRFSGFGSGRWASKSMLNAYRAAGARAQARGKKRRGPFEKNETDELLAARARDGAIVVTSEKYLHRSNSKSLGPLQKARKAGYPIIFLGDNVSGASLGNYIRSELARLGKI